MTELLSNLWLGFSVALSLKHLLFCFAGALVGTLVGVLPGLGPMATISLLLPITFQLDPISALIMLAGIYYGAQYGGSTTAILVNIPGESSSVVTAIDGYQMARQGRAGPALAIAALGSFFAGSIATLIVALAGPPMVSLALMFNATEYFSLMALGLVMAVVLSRSSVLKALLMIFAGLALAQVGDDPESGMSRFTFGLQELADGIDFIPLAMGIFGVAEILRNLEMKEETSTLKGRITGLMPTWSDIRQSTPAVLRGTALGSILGVLPGGGALLSSFASYTLEKRLAVDKSRFGKGAIEGVAGPESANNAGAQTSFIPMLTLGIPPNPVMALMVGAMMLHGIQPGPQIMNKQPELFWGLIASMWLGNLMLVLINLPLVGIWVKLISMPYRILFPVIVLFCCIGVYSVNYQPFDLVLTCLFGLFGYFLYKTNFDAAPLVLAFVLGRMLEENLRRALLLSRGDPMVFLERPISAVLLILAVVMLVLAILPAIRSKRENVFVE